MNFSSPLKLPLCPLDKFHWNEPCVGRWHLSQRTWWLNNVNTFVTVHEISSCIAARLLTAASPGPPDITPTLFSCAWLCAPQPLRVVANLRSRYVQSIGSGRTTLLSIRVFYYLHFCLFVHVALPWFCCSSCLYHLFFSYFMLCMYPPPPFFIVSSILFFSVAAFVIWFVFISSNVNCCERLVKTEGACTHFVFCCSLEVLVPLCFLVVFII